MAESYPSLTERPLKNTICLFDVDGTLTPARRGITPDMMTALQKLRHKCAIGFVGGSNLPKQQEQLSPHPSTPVMTLFDFCFSENGLIAYRLGQQLPSNSFIQHVGQPLYQRMVKFILRYIANIEGLPKMTGTFIEFRNGMINVSPVGRNASQAERDEFEKWDRENDCRPKMIEAIKKEFGDIGMVYSIGGQISFDVFPTGWDKTYCLQHIEAEATTPGLSGIKYDKIHFFGDKAFPGGNDWEIYDDSRTIGHKVKDPGETLKILQEEFGV